MKHLFQFITVTLLLCTLAAAECGSLPKAGPFISYTIEPKVTGNALSLAVTLIFRERGNSASLILPSQWQGQRDLYRAISKLEVKSPGTTLRASDQAWTRQVSFAVGQVVRIDYEVTRDWAGKIDASSYFRVMLTPSYVQVTGPNFLVYPSVPDDEDLPIFFEWKNVPSDWKVIDSFLGDGPCQYAKTKLTKISNGLFTAGDFRVTQVPVEGKAVFVAISGSMEFYGSDLR